MTGMIADNEIVEALVAKVGRGELTRTEALRECRDREDCSGLTWFAIAISLPYDPEPEADESKGGPDAE